MDTIRGPHTDPLLYRRVYDTAPKSPLRTWWTGFKYVIDTFRTTVSIYVLGLVVLLHVTAPEVSYYHYGHMLLIAHASVDVWLMSYDRMTYRSFHNDISYLKRCTGTCTDPADMTCYKKNLRIFAEFAPHRFSVRHFTAISGASFTWSIVLVAYSALMMYGYLHGNVYVLPEVNVIGIVYGALGAVVVQQRFYGCGKQKPKEELGTHACQFFYYKVDVCLYTHEELLYKIQ